MEFRNRKYAIVALLSLVLLFLTSAVAQETTAGVQGTVRDQSGAVVNKATVEVSSAALLGTKKVETDAAGTFRIVNLPPGMYTVTVTAAGFRTSKQTGIDLVAGRLPNMEIALQVGAVAETVEVSGTAPAVDVTQSKVQTTVPDEVLNSIPKGRSFQSVIPFAPGARQEPLQSRRDDKSRDNGFQIDGASDSENVYMVEGLDTTDIQDGGVGRSVPMEFIQEVQIKSSSFEAEFGGALGGVVNVVQKRGSNNWHGSLVGYLRSSALNANDQCGATPFPNALSAQQLACGLRSNPTTSLNTTTRTPAAAQYYLQKEDHRRVIEPGFEIGGPIVKDRLWSFLSYVPTIDRTRRAVDYRPSSGVNFGSGAAPGVRSFERREDIHNGLARLDFRATDQLRLNAAWQYGFRRVQGLLPLTPDSITGVNVSTDPNRNLAATTDPTSLRSDTGATFPSQVITFGGDWTPTSKAVVSARYGYFYTNRHDMFFPTGLRYLYQNTANQKTLAINSTADASGNCLTNCIPTAFQNSSGFNNMPSNISTKGDEYSRKAFNADFSYYVGNFAGTHTFKVGYGFNRLANKVFRGVNYAEVDLFYGRSYSVQTPEGQAACAAIRASNVTNFGDAGSTANDSCRGNFGYFSVVDGVNIAGNASSYNHGLFVQDQWTVGHGLTINAGVRFDKEFVPPFSAGSPSISFGFTDKVAPRIGGAYDLLRNGKVKLYASYGKFYDITKYSLPRGSFGGDYWRECYYAMDFTDFNTITPSAPEIVANGVTARHGCPPNTTTTQAPGVVVGRFIENVDFRHTTGGPGDPGIDPNIKPMSQHEYVAGADWAISPWLGLELRYSRKRLDNVIEDIGLTDSLGFYIGNPGTVYGDLARRPLPSSGITVAQCPDCPAQPKAIRNYDGLEVRLIKRASNKWYGSMSYTYSRLYGNYSGLTDSDITDGNGGRHSPNNHRAFDGPQMQFDAYGHIINGPLATDRPHTLKLFGYYRVPWLSQESLIGVSQFIFSGTPLSTCMPVIGTASSCVFVEGRGNWVDMHRAANGDILVDGVRKGLRTDAYTQTDLNLVHEVKVSKTNEAMRLAFEGNIGNLFNQRNVLSVSPNPFATGLVSPLCPASNTNCTQTGFDWKAVMTGWDYKSLVNSQGRTFNSQYGMPFLFQSSRNIRLAVKFRF